jgi:hypothetical protein
MLPLLVLRAAAGHVRIVNADMLLELLLEGIPLGHVVHAGWGEVVSCMPLGDMTVGVESRRGDVGVRREAVQRIGQHLVPLWLRCPASVRSSGK